MVKVVLFFLSFQFAISSMAQHADTSINSLTTEYLIKSNQQNKTAKILLIGGGALFGIGGALGVATVWNEVLDPDTDGFDIATGMIVVGHASMATSIPFFVSAGQNRRKAAAASVSFKLEKATIIKSSMAYTGRYPTVVIQIRL